MTVWALFFAPLSVYDIFGNPIFFSTSSAEYVDQKVLHYNFTMNGPVLARGNFSVSVPLDRDPLYSRCPPM